MKNSAKRPMEVWLMITIDLILLAAFLSTFCYYHHIESIWGAAIEGPAVTEPTPDVIFTRPPTVTSTPSTTAPLPPSTGDDPIPPQTGPIWDLSGDFGGKFYHKFSMDNEIVRTDSGYRSHDLCIELKKVDKILKQRTTKTAAPKDTHVIYHVAHIYVRNIDNLFSSHQVGKNNFASDLLKDTKAVFAINGDVFNTGAASKEVIVRNGELIRTKDYISADICVLYWDGTMETVTPAEYDWNKIAAKSPYQIWSFGPELLHDDGKAKTDIETAVWRLNPRAAIGYVEPGHYVMVAVDGSRDGKTTGGDGLNMDELARVMADEGCKQAYNLDGGASVYCYYDGNYPVSFSTNRKISDMICISEIR